MNDRAGFMQQSFRASLTRRAALASLVVAGALPLTASARQTEQSSATPVPAGGADQEPVVGESVMPQWRFIVNEVQDPYTGTLTKPDGLPAETRLIALEVVIANESDQPLEFTITDIRLRDVDGSEHRAGEYLGTEPRVVSQNLPDGERTRGWVWFAIQDGIEPASIVFVAPPPILRVPLA